MKRKNWFIMLSMSLLVAFSCSNNPKSEGEENGEIADEKIYEYGIPISDFNVQEGEIKNGDVFSTLMTRLGASQSDAYTLSERAKGVFDLKQIRVGNSYEAFYQGEEEPKLAYLVYERDKASFVVFRLIDTLGVSIIDKEIETKYHYSEVVINNSLWVDVKKAGVTPLLAVKLADIYAWTIDFFGLQKGDSFKALYEVSEYKGAIQHVERVNYVIFTHLGKEYPIYYFEDEGKSNRYWNEKGESVKKAFLKAPLSFTRISSGFSYARRHPITKIVRPHTGIDYAAPAGTPVMSIGDGVVVEKGFKGGGGHTVKIKHNSQYSSAYLHLSKYGKGVAVGKRVSQGQIIGYVGSTGSSTGPHLDFRIWKGGSPINPLKMESPSIEPIKKENLEAFKAVKEEAACRREKVMAENALTKMIEIVNR